MNTSEISQIILTKQLKLTKWKLIEYYLPTIIFLMMPILYFIFIVEAKIDNNTIVFDKIMSEIGYPIISLMIAIIMFGLYRRELRFKTINLKVSKKDFYKAIDLTQKEMNWFVIENTPKYVIACSKNNYGLWAATITIIRKHNFILINSIHRPYSNPISDRNNEHREAFKKNLKKLVYKPYKIHGPNVSIIE
jgi:hypothetical protein